MDIIPKSKGPYDPVGGRRRIRLMVLLLGFMLFLMIGVHIWGKRAAAPPPDKPAELIETRSFNTDPPPAPDEIYSPEELSIQNDMEDFTDDEILAEVKDDTKKVEIEALLVLLHRSRDLTDEIAGKQVDKELKPADLLDKPAKARARLILIEGQLHEKALPVPLGANATDIDTAWFVQIDDLSADKKSLNRYCVYLIDRPTGILPGERVRVYAHFLKLWERTDSRGKVTTLPTLVGRYLDPVDKSNRPDLLFYGMLEKCKNLTPHRARREVNLTIVRRDLIDRPAEAVGRLAFIEGRLSRNTRLVPLKKDNPTGIESVWSIELFDLSDPVDPKQLYLYSIEEPKAFEQGEMVRAYGYFLRTWKHKDKWGEETVDPLFVTKGLDPVDFLTDKWVLEKMVNDDRSHPDAKGLVYLAYKLKGVTPEELEKQADPDLHWEQLEIAPELNRGRVVHCRGTLARLRKYTIKMSDDITSRLGQKVLYEAHISIDQQRAFTVYLTEPPMGVRERDLVATEGLFLHNWRFETVAGGRRGSPIIVGIALRSLEQPQTKPNLLLYAALGAVMVVLVLLLMQESSRAGQARRAAHKRQMRKPATKVELPGDAKP